MYGYNLAHLRFRHSNLIRISFYPLVQTFHSSFHIAELLRSLQQSGNVKYIGWILQVPCSESESTITALQAQAKAMEAELAEWKEEVDCAQREFYELNYYTTAQLLTLRWELSMERAAYDMDPNSLFLLQSISSQINSGAVRDVVKKVTAATGVSGEYEHRGRSSSDSAEEENDLTSKGK